MAMHASASPYPFKVETMRIRPLPAPLGAEVDGVDLSRPLPPGTFAEIERAWRQRLVLVIHDQELSDPELIEFSRHWGELDPPGPNPYGAPFLPEHPEVNVISNVVEDGRPIGNLGAGEAVWHADMTYIDRPPKAAILHALEIPPSGGNTYFADMFAAYDALDADTKRRIEGRVAIHDASLNSAGMLRRGYELVTDVRQTRGARHPLVRTEAATGRKALFLGRRTNGYILDMELAESEALLDALWAHAGNMRFAMSHEWRRGDVLIWNNLSVLHRRDPFDPKARRVMHRTQIKGEEEVR